MPGKDKSEFLAYNGSLTIAFPDFESLSRVAGDNGLTVKLTDINETSITHFISIQFEIIEPEKGSTVVENETISDPSTVGNSSSETSRSVPSSNVKARGSGETSSFQGVVQTPSDSKKSNDIDEKGKEIRLFSF
jgi:hypothetical protein